MALGRVFQVTSRYPEDCASARQDHFKLLQANKLYYKAIIALVLLTIFEVPPWCHQSSPNQASCQSASRVQCRICGAGSLRKSGAMWMAIRFMVKGQASGDRLRYLSNIWYVPPGIGLVVEAIIEIIILRKAGGCSMDDID